MAKIGIQEVGETQRRFNALEGEVEQMLPLVNEVGKTGLSCERARVGVKCGGSDGFSGFPPIPHSGVPRIRSFVRVGQF